MSKLGMSFLFKSVYLILTLLLISFVINRVINLNLTISETMRERELRRYTTNILEILVTSHNCLAYEEENIAGTRTVSVIPQKIVDINKLDKFAMKYPNIEPDCARSYSYGYDVKVEKFYSNISTLGGTETFTICYIGGSCADPDPYFRNYPYKVKPISWSDIAQYKIKDCSAILISCPIAYLREYEGGVCSPSSYCCKAACKCIRADCKEIKDSLIRFVGEDGRLLITEGDAIEVINYMFPYEYVWPCKDCPAPQKDVYVTGICYGGGTKCVKLTDEGIEQLGSDVKTPFTASFYGHSRLMKINEDKIDVLAEFSETSCGANGYVPPVQCSNAVITHITYGTGDIIHQIPLLEYQLSTDYGKIDILGIYLKSFIEGSTKRNFQEPYQIWKFGSPTISQSDALKTRIVASMPVSIRINESYLQPGLITVALTDGELEEFSGMINSVCDTNNPLSKDFYAHYRITQTEDENICQEVDTGTVCRKISCKASVPAFGPGKYSLFFKKEGGKVVVEV